MSAPPRLTLREMDTPLGSVVIGAVEPGASRVEPGGICLLELGDDDRRRREIGELESHFGSSFEPRAESETLGRQGDAYALIAPKLISISRVGGIVCAVNAPGQLLLVGRGAELSHCKAFGGGGGRCGDERCGALLLK